MEKIFAYLFFITLVISFGMIFYLLLNTNFEKIFKKGKITEIRISFFLVSFIIATIISIGVTSLVEAIYTILIK